MSQTIALEVIAIAAVLIACVHVAVFIAVLVVVTRVTQVAARIERTAVPVLAHLDEVAAEASHSLSLVRSQLRRWERTVTDKFQIVDRTVGKLQYGIAVPVREGAALVAGVRAVIRAFRDWPKPIIRRRT